jgi:hypothetical protein
MPTTISPEWQQMALYALGGGVGADADFAHPYVGKIVRFAVSGFTLRRNR